jgi:hypothetical protein
MWTDAMAQAHEIKLFRSEFDVLKQELATRHRSEPVLQVSSVVIVKV